MVKEIEKEKTLNKKNIFDIEWDKISFTTDPQENGASKLYKKGKFELHQTDENDNHFVTIIDNEVVEVKTIDQLNKYLNNGKKR